MNSNSDPKGQLINQLLAKSKVDPNFLRRIIETGGISQSRIQIVWKLQESKIDFRALIKFKENLFQGTKISTDNKISEEEFKRLRAASDLSEIKNNIC